jgi:ABC-type glycerol-3-phosphate transport system permease component
MITTQFNVIAKMNLINTYTSVILVYVGIMLPMTIYLFRNSLITLPDSIMEAAYIEGANSFQTLYMIVFPLSKASILTACVVNFVWVWNELLISLVFLQRDSMRTVIAGITLFRGRYTLDVPVVLAGLTTVSVPVVVFYLICQRFLVQGVLAGAVKE